MSFVIGSMCLNQQARSLVFCDTIVMILRVHVGTI